MNNKNAKPLLSLFNTKYCHNKMIGTSNDNLDFKSRLNNSTQTLNSSQASLDKSEQLLNEIEQQAIDISNTVHSQTHQIKQMKQNIDQIDDELTIGNRILK